MQREDWQTPFARELLALAEARIADRLRDLEKSSSHETTRHAQGRIKELRWLIELKDAPIE